MCLGGYTADDSVTASSRPVKKAQCIIVDVYYMCTTCTVCMDIGAFSQLHISSTEW